MLSTTVSISTSIPQTKQCAHEPVRSARFPPKQQFQPFIAPLLTFPIASVSTCFYPYGELHTRARIPESTRALIIPKRAATRASVMTSDS